VSGHCSEQLRDRGPIGEPVSGSQAAALLGGIDRQGASEADRQRI